MFTTVTIKAKIANAIAVVTNTANKHARAFVGEIQEHTQK